ncbi:MAG: hypothetical protein RLZ79_2077 [Pseudomonadota bacterium]|jgi:hypothetical protein
MISKEGRCEDGKKLRGASHHAQWRTSRALMVCVAIRDLDSLRPE